MRQYQTGAFARGRAAAGLRAAAGAIEREPTVKFISFIATLAQINAGLTLVADVAGRKLKPLEFLLKVNGTFATLTDVRLSDTASSPVDITTTVAANLTAGAKLNSVAANSSLGAGHNAYLTSHKGIQIRKTGSTGTGGTDISGWIMYEEAIV